MFDIQKSILMQTVFFCKSKNNLEDAKTFLNIAAKYCNNIETLDEIAYLQSEIKDYVSCINTLKRCLGISRSLQEQYAIRANLAKTYNHLNEPMLSIGYSQANLEIENDLGLEKDYDTRMEISFSHYLQGDYDTSEKMMRELAADEKLPEQVRGRVLYNLGSYDLEKSNFKSGIKGFVDIGHKIGIWPNREFSNIPKWDGTPIPGKTVLIHGEGGIGDEVICVRFMNNVKRLGMNPIWITGNEQLKTVFNRNGFTTVSSVDVDDYKDSVQCMAMYLPVLLDLDINEVYDGDYLKPSPEYIEKWNKILPEGNKVAIRWSGQPMYDQNLHRRIPLKKFVEAYGKLENTTLISVQKDDGIEELEDYPEIFNAGKYLETLEDLLACLHLCDMTVSSCTSVAHFSASSGCKTIVYPPIACYYVWLGANGNSHWYGHNVTVIRQRKWKSWDHVRL